MTSVKLVWKHQQGAETFLYTEQHLDTKALVLLTLKICVDLLLSDRESNRITELD